MRLSVGDLGNVAVRVEPPTGCQDQHPEIEELLEDAARELNHKVSAHA